MYVLNIGEYDERVFLGEEATTEIGTPTKVPLVKCNWRPCVICSVRPLDFGKILSLSLCL